MLGEEETSSQGDADMGYDSRQGVYTTSHWSYVHWQHCVEQVMGEEEEEEEVEEGNEGAMRGCGKYNIAQIGYFFF